MGITVVLGEEVGGVVGCVEVATAVEVVGFVGEFRVRVDPSAEFVSAG